MGAPELEAVREGEGEEGGEAEGGGGGVVYRGESEKGVVESLERTIGSRFNGCY